MLLLLPAATFLVPGREFGVRLGRGAAAALSASEQWTRIVRHLAIHDATDECADIE